MSRKKQMKKQMNCTKCGEALKELITELKEKINL